MTAGSGTFPPVVKITITATDRTYNDEATMSDLTVNGQLGMIA